MIGAIIGDIVGSRFEFSPTNDYYFDLFGAGSDFTDDSICTFAVAQAALDGADYGECLHRWCRAYPYPKGGYGGRFLGWVASDNPQPYNSLGNGSAMRVSSIGWLFEEPDTIMAEAVKSAECTHNHPAGIIGAQAVAIAIGDCRRLRSEKGGEIDSNDILHSGLARALRLYGYSDPGDFKLEIEDYRNRFDETCPGTVPPALAIVRDSRSFEDALRLAVSLGADADTIGAIVGGIAEALWGVPEWMVVKAESYLEPAMMQVLTDFRSRMAR